MYYIYRDISSTAPSGHPYNIEETQITHSSLTISWIQPHPSQWNGIIQYYVVYISKVESPTKPSVYTTSSTTLTITGLSPYTFHEVKVAAVTIAQGPNSTVRVFRTEEHGMSPAIAAVDAITAHHRVAL